MFGDSHGEDLFAAPRGSFERLGADSADISPSINGDTIRDWAATQAGELLLAPGPVAQPTPSPGTLKALWPWRTNSWDRATFNAGSYREAGRHWLSWHQISVRDVQGRRLDFAKIATHNQFALVTGPLVEKPSALRVELPADATEDEHLALLGVLNSSTACFWLKQNSHNKGEGGGARVDAGYAARGEPFRETYEFTGTTLQDYPLPAVLPLERARRLDALAAELAAQFPEAVAARRVPTRLALDAARAESERLRTRMVAVQEELDWEVYRLYGLVTDDLTYPGEDLPGVALGERAFEIALARQAAAGEVETTWFTHPQQSSTPIPELPGHWPAAYRDLVQRRLDLIASDPAIRLLEKPEHKRRWASEPWEKQQDRALRGWLLDRLEDRRFWFDGQGRPMPRSIAQLADEVARDADLLGVLSLWDGRRDAPVTESLVRLLGDEAVPYLAAYRYKDSGLRKREAWEQTWALQRREDAGEQVGTIPVPPKYTSTDFRKPSYWQARGKLDVPKERFVLYPAAGRDTDPTPLLGWAGWDHAQQSLALSLVMGAREADGWPDERLVPLVAGLAELQPWVEQWHSEIDPTYGVSLAAFTREQLTQRMTQVGTSREQLAAWRPEPAVRGRKPKSS